MNSKVLFTLLLGIILISALLAALLQIRDTSLRPTPTQAPYIQEPENNIVEAEGELVEGFPEFPVYPGAEIHESAVRRQAYNTGRDIYAEWTTNDSVIEVMRWYEQELSKLGWSIGEPNDPENPSEQIIQITKDNLSGYVAAEDEEGTTEIVVDLKKATS